MNWNKIGKNVRKATNGVSSRIFGIMELRLDKQAGKTLPEDELKKNQAIDLIRTNPNIYPHNPLVIRSLPFDNLLFAM